MTEESSDMKTDTSKSVSSTQTPSRKHHSRSRCFKIFKWTLMIMLLGLFVATLASTPWCVELARDLLKDINSTTMGQVYSGYEPIQLTDSLVYGVVGVALFLTFLLLLFGTISVWRESFVGSLVFSVLLLLCVAGSACCYHHTLFLINIIVDVVLGVLVFFYSICIKRADRLAPEDLMPDDISRAKSRDLEAEHLTENLGDENLRV